MFGCARHKLMTHYIHTGTVRDRVARQASRYDRENEAVLLCWHLHQRFWTATVSARGEGLSASTIHLISADRPQKVRQWRDVTGLPMCNALDAISSGSVSTGTGFRSVAKPDLHSAMLVVKRTNKHCWDCYVLESDRFGGGSFVVWGWKKMGDQKTYFVVMQDNFNALYRRHLVTISPLFIHIKNWSDIWN